MKARQAILSIALVQTGLTVAQAGPAKESRKTLPPEDIATIRAMVPAMELAWQSHNAAAYAAQFVSDAEHINAYGMWWRGRTEIEQGIAFALTRIYPENPISASEVTVSGVSHDAAVVQYRWRLSPYSDPDGTAYSNPQGRVTELVVRTPVGWRIRTFQSTFINSNVPQPR